MPAIAEILKFADDHLRTLDDLLKYQQMSHRGELPRTERSRLGIRAAEAKTEAAAAAAVPPSADADSKSGAAAAAAAASDGVVEKAEGTSLKPFAAKDAKGAKEGGPAEPKAASLITLAPTALFQDLAYASAKRNADKLEKLGACVCLCVCVYVSVSLRVCACVYGCDNCQR